LAMDWASFTRRMDRRLPPDICLTTLESPT